MADDRSNQSGRPRGPDRPRKPPTIDLAAEAVMPVVSGPEGGGDATEIGARPGQPAAQDGRSGVLPDPAGVGAPIAADQVKKATGAVPPAAAAKPATAGKPGPDAKASSTAAKPVIPSAFAPGARSTPVGTAVGPGRRGGLFAALLLAAVLGGLIVEAGDLAAGRLGWFAPAAPDGTAMRQEVAALRSDLDAARAQIGTLQQPASAVAGDTDITALRGELSALQGTVAELGNRPTPQADGPQADTAALYDLQKRITALEQAPPPAAAEAAGTGPAFDALNAQLGDIGSRVAALEGKPAPDLSGLETGIASLRGGLAEIGGRVDTVNAAERLAALEPRVAAAEAGTAATRGLAQAVAADALAATAASGRPFAAELATLRSLGVDDPAFADLAPKAGAGLPGDAALATEFRTLSEGLRTNAPVPATAGPVDRLLQSARGLVQVRPAGPAAGSDPGSVMARIVDFTGRGELAGALHEWDTLPDMAKSATAAWASEMRTRLAAETLAARLRGEALARLAQPS